MPQFGLEARSAVSSAQAVALILQLSSSEELNVVGIKNIIIILYKSL